MGSADATLDAVSGSPACPFCAAAAAERVGQWGGQIITAQWRCDACNSYFEAIRETFDDVAPRADVAPGAGAAPREDAAPTRSPSLRAPG